jgi:sterol desaturase/sphingolipid hydroxylase (fatty acid hydroxylase superfamily)
MEALSALIYVALGIALALASAGPLRGHKRLLSALILAPVIIPAFIDRVPRNWVQSAMYVVLLAIEALFGHQRHPFTSAENLRNAALVSFKRCAFLLLKVSIFAEIARWGSPRWGLGALEVPLGMQAIAAFLILDLYQYACHRAQHRFEGWWRLHKLHHAPTEMTVLVTSRSHLADTIARQIVGPGLLVYAMGLSADAVLYGSLFPSVVLDAFSHANLDFPGKRFRWLTYLVSLPNLHALHHTTAHDRSNYGMCLTIWDRLFGTFEMPEARPTSFGILERRYAELGLLEQHLDSLGLLTVFDKLRGRAEPRSNATS